MLAATRHDGCAVPDDTGAATATEKTSTMAEATATNGSGSAPADEAQKTAPPLAAVASSNGGDGGSSVAKKRKKDGLKPIITKEDATGTDEDEDDEDETGCVHFFLVPPLTYLPTYLPTCVVLCYYSTPSPFVRGGLFYTLRRGGDGGRAGLLAVGVRSWPKRRHQPPGFRLLDVVCGDEVTTTSSTGLGSTRTVTERAYVSARPLSWRTPTQPPLSCDEVVAWRPVFRPAVCLPRQGGRQNKESPPTPRARPGSQAGLRRHHGQTVGHAAGREA